MKYILFDEKQYNNIISFSVELSSQFVRIRRIMADVSCCHTVGSFYHDRRDDIFIKSVTIKRNWLTKTWETKTVVLRFGSLVKMFPERGGRTRRIGG